MVHGEEDPFLTSSWKRCGLGCKEFCEASFGADSSVNRARPGSGFRAHSRWNERVSPSSSVGDALEELANEAYLYLLEEKFSFLKKALFALDERKKKGEEGYHHLDPLARIYLRGFIGLRHKASDPIGWKAWSMVAGALKDLIEEDLLQIVSGTSDSSDSSDASDPPKLGNDTVLSFFKEESPETVASPGEVRRATGAWSGPLLLKLAIGHGRQLVEPQEELRKKLLGLPRAGVQVFRFQDLLAPMKEEFRSMLVSCFVEDYPQDGVPPALGAPGFAVSLETREHFEELAKCIESGIKGVTRPGRRAKLERLWAFFRLFATHDIDPRKLAGTQLEEALEISRNGLPKLRNQLGTMYYKCQETLYGRAAEGMKGSLGIMSLGGQSDA